MAVSLANLPKGHEFAEAKFELTQAWLEEYRAAVEDESDASRGVPPLALAAVCLRELLAQTTLPEGAIHVGQELNFSLSEDFPSELAARARIASRGERAGWVLMGIEMEVADETGTPMMGGRATITFPAAREDRGDAAN